MSKSVIAIVKGGLGNQLFIYAAAWALALHTGRALYLDSTRGYTNDDYGRCYRLNRFPIQASSMPEAWRIAPTLQHRRHKIIRAWNKLYPRNLRTYFGERHHRSADQLTSLTPVRNRITLLGYWQNEAYFADAASRIREELTPPAPADEKNRALVEKFAAGDSVFVHFRRVRYQHLLDRDYYQSAIDAACSRLAHPRFILFGDDLKWPEQNLDFREAHVTVMANNGEDELADLWLMTRCRHAIVANSSFSWWGAWLGDTGPKRLILAPADAGLPLVMSVCWERV